MVSEPHDTMTNSVSAKPHNGGAMTSYDSEFDALLGRGHVYDSAAHLRATPAGTPITDAEGGHWIYGYNDPAEPRWRVSITAGQGLRI